MLQTRHIEDSVIWGMRTLLFATNVLLVEGPTDREIVQCIFTKYKHNILQKEAKANVKKNHISKKKNGGRSKEKRWFWNM